MLMHYFPRRKHADLGLIDAIVQVVHFFNYLFQPWYMERFDIIMLSDQASLD